MKQPRFSNPPSLEQGEWKTFFVSFKNKKVYNKVNFPAALLQDSSFFIVTRMSETIIKIAVATPFEDAGDATRAIEIAKGIVKYAPKGFNSRIIFLSHGSRFEKLAHDCGFEIYHIKPKLDGIGVDHDLKMTQANFVGKKDLAKKLLKTEIETYKKIKPDVILYGFWPMAGLARRMLKKEIFGICFLPLPLTDAFMDAIPDVPEEVKFFSTLPRGLRLWLLRNVPRFIEKRMPPLRQPNILEAAYKLGWKGEPLADMFDMLKPDLMVVNDLHHYYNKIKFSKNVVFTGPLFFESNKTESVPREIQKIFSPHNKKTKVFCTLGSSGAKKQLLEIVKAFTYGGGLNWDAVILSPSSVCPIKEAKKILGMRQGVYITGSFIPADKVNALADIVISHGGQGTIQTAMRSGTPLVGVAMQPEQFINLYNIELAGAGIHIPFNEWNCENIQESVNDIIHDNKFKKAALHLKRLMDLVDGQKNCSKIIWEKLVNLKR